MYKVYWEGKYNHSNSASEFFDQAVPADATVVSEFTTAQQLFKDIAIRDALMLINKHIDSSDEMIDVCYRLAVSLTGVQVDETIEQRIEEFLLNLLDTEDAVKDIIDNVIM